jgi:hypothetical protein
MQNNFNYQSNNNDNSNFENKIGKIFIWSVKLLMPLVILIYGFFTCSLNSKYYQIASFLLRFISPLLLLTVLGSMLVWCLIQVKNGISGKPMLLGKLNRQPFIFLGVIIFLFLSISCILLFAVIFYLFFI